MRFIVGLFCLVLAGCSYFTQRPLAPFDLKLSPASLGETISVQQHLQVERDNHLDTLDAVLEVDATQLNLVGLVLGRRVLTLHYDEKTLQSWRHPMLPKAVKGEDILRDLQLTVWPVAVIQAALPTSFTLIQQHKQRTLFENGKPYMVIDYSGEKPWQGKVELHNLKYDYQLIIDSVVMP